MLLDGSSGNLSMSSLASATRRRVVRDNILLPIVFFMSPLATSVAPRLTPFFVAITGMALIGSAPLSGIQWRRLLPRQPALAACLVFAVYVFLNATWSVDSLAGLGKAALLLADFNHLRRSRSGFGIGKNDLVAGSDRPCCRSLSRRSFHFGGVAHGGIVLRTLLVRIPAKHFRFSNGAPVALNPSKLDQNVNLAMFHLWPGLLALMGLTSTRRTIAMVLFFAAIATVVACPSMTPHKSQ
jgi:hypothetical protein